MRGTNLEVVHVTEEGQGDGRSEPLLQETANLAVAIELCPERRLSEVVLDTNVRNTLAGWAAAHHAALRSEHELEVGTSLNLVRDPPPVAGLENTLGLKLRCRNPVLRSVPSDVRDSGLGSDAHGLPLPDTLNSEREVGGDGLKMIADKHTSRSSVQERWVVGAETHGEVLSLVLILNGDDRAGARL